MSTPTSRAEKGGFTLVELCVVVVILGVVTALVATRLDAVIPARRLRRATSELVGAVRFARDAARMRRVEVMIEYDLDEGSWRVLAPVPDYIYEKLESDARRPAGDRLSARGAAGRTSPAPSAALYSRPAPGGSEDEPPPRRRPRQYWSEEELEVLLSGELPEGVRFERLRYGESGYDTSGRVRASVRPSGAAGEHMVVLAGEETSARAVYVPALTGAAFVVSEGIDYESIRSARRM